MKKKIVLAVLMILSSVFLPAKVLAAEIGENRICGMDGVDKTAKEAAGCNKPENEDEVGNAMLNIINVVIAVLGIIAVLFVVIGGAQYMTSRGDPTKASKAKDTILYAVLGVLLATFAYAIVNFVLGGMLSGSGGQPETSQEANE